MVLKQLATWLYIGRAQQFAISHDFEVILVPRTVGLVVMIAAFHLTD
jgi:hypothetical protein